MNGGYYSLLHGECNVENFVINRLAFAPHKYACFACSISFCLQCRIRNDAPAPPLDKTFSLSLALATSSSFVHLSTNSMEMRANVHSKHINQRIARLMHGTRIRATLLVLCRRNKTHSVSVITPQLNYPKYPRAGDKRWKCVLFCNVSGFFPDHV